MRELADNFAKAFEEGDVATINSIYAPNAVVWHNTDEREQPRDENIALARAVPTIFSSFKYRDVRVQVFDGGYVQQHVLHAVQMDGSNGSLMCHTQRHQVHYAKILHVTLPVVPRAYHVTDALASRAEL